MNAEQASIAAALAVKAAVPETFILLASAARAVTTTSAVQSGVGGHKNWAFVLDITDADAAAGDKLDVVIQFSLDNVAWYDAVHFTQVLGDSADVQSFIFNGCYTTTAAAPVVLTTPLTSGVGRQSTCWGNYLRAVATIVDVGTASFTFSVSALGL